MAETASPSGARFALALAQGLCWGIVGAAALAVVILVVAAFSSGMAPAAFARMAFELIVWTTMVAGLLAVFPVGPIAGVAGWFLYRGGARAPLAYAVLGALSAVCAPALLLVIATETQRYEASTNYAVIDPGAVWLSLAFPVIGAFAGFMAGRALRAP